MGGDGRRHNHHRNARKEPDRGRLRWARRRPVSKATTSVAGPRATPFLRLPLLFRRELGRGLVAWARAAAGGVSRGRSGDAADGAMNGGSGGGNVHPGASRVRRTSSATTLASPRRLRRRRVACAGSSSAWTISSSPWCSPSACLSSSAPSWTSSRTRGFRSKSCGSGNQNPWAARHRRPARRGVDTGTVVVILVQRDFHLDLCRRTIHHHPLEG